MSVYKGYSREELNYQYNVRLQVPDYASYFDRWERLSRQTELDYTVQKDISYGNHPKERLDIFPSGIPHSKTLVFIHGGYWHLLDKAMFYFLAAHFLKYSVTTVLVNYPLAPESSIDEIVLSSRKSIRWIHENIKRFNGDPAELFLLGHSAGGHLASMLLIEHEAAFVRCMISLSGLFRLEPIVLSYLNESIGMDRDEEIRNSPVFLNPSTDCPVLLVKGTDESDEFKAQSEELYHCWKMKMSNIKVLDIPGKNHYSIIDAVLEKGSPLRTAILHLMNIQDHEG